MTGDRVIRLATAAMVCAVAAFVAVVSYSHIYGLRPGRGYWPGTAPKHNRGVSRPVVTARQEQGERELTGDHRWQAIARRGRLR